MTFKQNKFGNYQCPCCEYFTLSEDSEYSYEICPVCFGEVDPIQLEDPNYGGGANVASLNEARENFKNFGAAEERDIKNVRRPFSDELAPPSPSLTCPHKPGSN